MAMVAVRLGVPLHLQAARLLIGAAVGAYTGAGLLWLGQAWNATRVNHALLITGFCWLLTAGRIALKVGTMRTRYRSTVRALSCGVDLDTATPYNYLIAHKPLYTACGWIAGAATAATVLLDVEMAVGAIPLHGANLFLCAMFSLGVISECTAIRVLGPQCAAADTAYRQARRSAWVQAGRPGTLTLVRCREKRRDEAR